eukprot:CAMPEP_0177761366 /NCGR_PEP_ID=MMETSP0491_2-20121128/5765_1 /TAXON_ID=63592 /ORGANISM="Tetraselmis chuii, Strain PLY429" /LENGTH=158 /DNA_ID=CAMNT_0019277333 /DNA_START=1 /DNA_END=477 /DNA_ORIENTATION=-
MCYMKETCLAEVAGKSVHFIGIKVAPTEVSSNNEGKVATESGGGGDGQLGQQHRLCRSVPRLERSGIVLFLQRRLRRQLCGLGAGQRAAGAAAAVRGAAVLREPALQSRVRRQRLLLRSTTRRAGAPHDRRALSSGSTCTERVRRVLPTAQRPPWRRI